MIMYYRKLKKKYTQDFLENCKTPFNLHEIKTKLTFVEKLEEKNKPSFILSYINLSFLFIISLMAIGRGVWLISKYDHSYFNDPKDIIFYFILGGFLLLLFLTNLIFFIKKNNQRV